MMSFDLYTLHFKYNVTLLPILLTHYTIIMSNFSEDPKGRSSKKNRKDRSALRVGDEVENVRANQQLMAPQHSNTAFPASSERPRAVIPVPPPPPRKYSNHPPNLTLSQNQNVSFSSLVARQSFSFLTTEGLLRTREPTQNDRNLASGAERATTANPIVPRDISETQPKMALPALALPQPQKMPSSRVQDLQKWKVPIESSLFQRNPAEQKAFSNFTAFTRGETKDPKLGFPRKVSQGITSGPNSSTPLVPVPNPPYYKEKLPEDDIKGMKKSTQIPVKTVEKHQIEAQNAQTIQSPVFPQNQVSSSYNSAEAVLLQFIRNQTSALSALLAQGITPPRPPPSSFLRPSYSLNWFIPSSQAHFLQNLQVSLEPFNPCKTIKPNGQKQYQEGNGQSPSQMGIDSTVSHFLLLHYLITEQACRNKTNNIHLVFDRLQAYLNRQESTIFVQKGSIPLQTKVKYLKEYFPYLASIKQWHQEIKDNIIHCENIVRSFRKRNTAIAEKKLLTLKSCGAKAKQALDLLNSTVRTMTLISEQTEAAGEMMAADSINNKQFTYVHPNDGIVLICEKMAKDYQSMQEKAEELLCLIPMHYNPTQDRMDGIQVFCELLKKLEEESGNFCRLQARVHKMKERYPERREHPLSRNQQSSLQKAKQHWRMVDLFHEISSILRRRAASDKFTP